MHKMSPSLRLLICGVIILLSAVYAVLVARDPSFASTVAIGYVAVVVTAILVVNLWKKV